MIDEMIKKAEEELVRLSANPETRRLYELREKQIRDEVSRLSGAKEEGLEEGLEIGLEKGKQENTIDIAKKLRNKGMDLADISDVTGLSEEEIKQLT